MKKLYFSENTFLKSISIWSSLKPTLGFRISTSLGAWVVRSTKWGVYKCHSFDSWASLMESKEQETKHFVSTLARAQPMHTTQNTHTWGGVQLHRVAWDSYVWISTFVAWETSNNKFTIPLPILPIANKRQVTYYPRVTKNEKQTWPTTATINQTN